MVVVTAMVVGTTRVVGTRKEVMKVDTVVIVDGMILAGERLTTGMGRDDGGRKRRRCGNLLYTNRPTLG